MNTGFLWAENFRIFFVSRKTPNPKKKMTSRILAGRLIDANAEWVFNFLQRTGSPHSNLINESLVIARETLEKRLQSGDVLYKAVEESKHRHRE
jgi:hypothetical protein